mmetsp:Transcript_28410/g.56816  ORF Transcript_28410/g.56816 Transcript_28410/m.56816 type:complete len:226 (-) Transcript_28410:194-871(-)
MGLVPDHWLKRRKSLRIALQLRPSFSVLLGVRELVPLLREQLADLFLVELPGGRQRDFFPDQHIVRQLELGERLGTMVLDFLGDVRGRPRARLGREHHDGHWPLVPLWMRHGNDSRHGHAVNRSNAVLEIYRGNPLATRLDDVLRAIRDDDRALPVDQRHVARDQPALVEFVRRIDVEVLGGDPWAADEQLARGTRGHILVQVVRVRDAHLHPGQGDAGLHAIAE